MAIGFVFDGPNRRIAITHEAGDVVDGAISFQGKDIYSAWKDWCINSVGLQYPQAFRVVGGDPVSNTVNTGSYFFQRTDLGWMINPPATDNLIINISGNIFPNTVGDPLIEPRAGYVSTIIMRNSSLTETVVTSDGLNASQAALLQTAASESTKGRKMQTNRAIISGDEQTVHIYDDDGTTLLHTFDVSADKKTRAPV